MMPRGEEDGMSFENQNLGRCLFAKSSECRAGGYLGCAIRGRMERPNFRSRMSYRRAQGLGNETETEK